MEGKPLALELGIIYNETNDCHLEFSDLSKALRISEDYFHFVAGYAIKAGR